MFLFRNPRERWTLSAVSETCLNHERLSVIVTPRYLLPSTISKVCPCSVYVDWILCLLLVLNLITVHLLGLKLICSEILLEELAVTGFIYDVA